MRSVDVPMGRLALSIAADIELSRTRFSVSHPVAVWRWSWTYLPANVRAATTFVEKRLPDRARMLTSGRTPTVTWLLTCFAQAD